MKITLRMLVNIIINTLTSGHRDIIISKMAEAGVQCVVQYCPLNRYDFYKKLGYGESDCPNTDMFFDNMISFPFQHMMDDETFSQLIVITKNVLREL